MHSLPQLRLNFFLKILADVAVMLHVHNTSQTAMMPAQMFLKNSLPSEQLDVPSPYRDS
jgi:hypothetical protein